MSVKLGTSVVVKNKRTHVPENEQVFCSTLQNRFQRTGHNMAGPFRDRYIALLPNGIFQSQIICLSEIEVRRFRPKQSAPIPDLLTNATEFQ